MKFKSLWAILCLGILIRIFIAAFSYHPDVKIHSFVSAVILREHNLNPYNYVSSLSPRDEKRQIFSTDLPDDLPLLYWTRLPFDLPFRPLINSKLENLFLSNTGSLLGQFSLNGYLLFLKTPLLFFDILLGWVFSLLFLTNLRKKALLFWMLNPMTLWATAAIGQYDIIPTFFIMLSLLLIKKDKLGLSALSLGVGAAIKSFPFLIAPYLILLGKNWTERFKLAGLVALPYILTILPYSPGGEFRQQALFAPHLAKMLYAQINLSGGEGIMIVPVIFALLYVVYEQRKKTWENCLAFMTITLLLLLAFTHFHIQWFLWVTPLLVFYWLSGLTQAEKLSLGFLGGAVVSMMFLFDASLQLRLFAPLFPNLENMIGLGEILNSSQTTFLRSLAATIFAASSIFFSLRLLMKNRSCCQ